MGQQYDEAEAMGLLQHLDKDTLQQLLDSEMRLSELINDLQQVKNMQSEREMQVASNRSLAEYNLGRQGRLSAARDRLTAALAQQTEARDQLLRNKALLDSSDAPQSLDTVLAILQTKADEAEQDSEVMASKFLSGEVDNVETFLEAFIPRRQVAHLRQMKAEKLQEIILKQRRF